MIIRAFMVYPENAPGGIAAGAGPMKGAIDNVAREPADQGFERLRLEFYRTGGANPGTERAIDVTLGRYR